MRQEKVNKHPVLKVPLDISIAVDKEIYDILRSFPSGVEAKHFVCSAILYYARSPLVLSANAIQEKLDKINFEDFGYMRLLLEEISGKLDTVSVVGALPVTKISPEVEDKSVTVDTKTMSVLTSLKEKFKV